LQKDLKRRYQDIGDVRYEIGQALADPGGVLVQPITGVEPRTRLKTTLLWVAAIILAVAIVGLVIWNLRTPVPPQVTRFYCELPENKQFYSPTEPALAVSPDGRQFVYSTSEGLYLRSLGEMDAKLITGTANESIGQPFFSPDGKWIGYWSPADLQLKKIAIGGGAPVVLCNTSSSFGGASWDSDSTIVYSDLGGGGVMRIPANGGTPEYLVKRKSTVNSGFFLYPQLLPDGKSVLFTKITARQDSTSAQIMVQSPASEEPKELFKGYVARYLPTGHIAYIVGANIRALGKHNLFAVLFDLNKLEATGGPVSLVQDIRGPFGAHYAISDSGTLIYRPGTAGSSVSGQTLVWVDRKGKEELLTAPPKIYNSPKISPDGTRVALTIRETQGNVDIWVWDLIRRTLTRLTFVGKSNSAPTWTPDGKRIAFLSSERDSLHEKTGVYWKASDGTGADELLVLFSQLSRYFFPVCWSSGGKNLVGTESLDFRNYDITMLSMEGNHARTPLLQEEYSENQPQISPNGHWIAYASNESNNSEIYVRSFPEVNMGRWQISTGGGHDPLWSPQGNELLYLNGDATMAVSVETEHGFNVVGTPQVLFRGTYAGPWDISPDGKRFLVIKPSGIPGEKSAAETPGKINVVLNWFEELKQLVPVP
jgi:Tol biopolymer transport system component